MKNRSTEESNHYAGLDWGSKQHEVAILGHDGLLVESFSFQDTDEGWKDFAQRMKAHPDTGVCVELRRGAVVQRMLGLGIRVHPLDPFKTGHYRGLAGNSGNKTDLVDAVTLANALRLDGAKIPPLQPLPQDVEKLRILCEQEKKLVAECTAKVNQLRAVLKQYYPAMLAAFDDWKTHGAWDFLLSYPSQRKLDEAKEEDLLKRLAALRLNNAKRLEERMGALLKRRETVCPEGLEDVYQEQAVFIANQLKLIGKQRKTLAKQIWELFSKQDKAGVAMSVPGVGKKLAPRLFVKLSVWGSRVGDAAGLQAVAGTCPRSFQSGQLHIVTIRRMCDKGFRHTMSQIAEKSTKKCPWAKVFYDEKTSKGKTRAMAHRALGNKWLKIIWKMWCEGKNYDSELHQQNQLKHGSWILGKLPSKDTNEPCE
jgi:hypothetical protein